MIPAPTPTAEEIERIVGRLTKAQRAAVLRCVRSPLGSVTPISDRDARLLYDAGLGWTDLHWWRQLNETGLAVRDRIMGGER